MLIEVSLQYEVRTEAGHTLQIAHCVVVHANFRSWQSNFHRLIDTLAGVGQPHHTLRHTQTHPFACDTVATGGHGHFTTALTEIVVAERFDRIVFGKDERKISTAFNTQNIFIQLQVVGFIQITSRALATQLFLEILAPGVQARCVCDQCIVVETT